MSPLSSSVDSLAKHALTESNRSIFVPQFLGKLTPFLGIAVPIRRARL